MGELFRFYRWQPDDGREEGGSWVAATNGPRPVVCEADEVPEGAPRKRWHGKGEAVDLFGVLVPASAE